MSSPEERRLASRREGGEGECDNFDDIENQLSGRRELDSQLSEGDDAGDLTEIAAPAPVDRSYSRPDSLEKKEDQVRRQRIIGADNGEEGLTEVVAPTPIERNRSCAMKVEEQSQHAASPSANSSEGPDQEEKSVRDPIEISNTATEFYIHSHLVFFSIMGTLGRLGIEAITAYPDAPFLSPVLWANMCGTFFLGFLTEDRQIFRQEWGSESEEWSFHPSQFDASNEEKLKQTAAAHGKVKKTIPLFIGHTVGFCGSFTSFSSFIRDVFLAAINKLSDAGAGTSSSAINTSYRSGGNGFEAAVAVLIIQIGVSAAALNVGAHCAAALDRWMPTLPFRFVRRVVDPLAVIAGFGCWIGAVLMSIWPPENVWRGQVLLALVFAPVGCLLRFHVSKSLNNRIPSFPLGTFCVNIFGTAILGMCYDLQHSGLERLVTSCQLLVGVEEGFCGCLTTVSTWVLEMDTLRARHAYGYGLMSVAVALGSLVAIVGSLEWTRGISMPLC